MTVQKNVRQISIKQAASLRRRRSSSFSVKWISLLFLALACGEKQEGPPPDDMGGGASSAQTQVTSLEGEKGEEAASQGLPPLYAAAKEGNLQEAAKLVNQGAAVDILNVDRQTPLHGASAMGRVAVMVFLINKGANILAQDKYGFTPLHWAADNGQIPAISELCRGGRECGLSVKDQDGMIPLHRAADKGHRTAAAVLIDKGSNHLAVDAHGRTPYGLAVQGQHQKVVDLFHIKFPEPEEDDAS